MTHHRIGSRCTTPDCAQVHDPMYDPMCVVPVPRQTGKTTRTPVHDPLWMRVVARLSTADWWAIGTAAVVGVVGGVLVGLWYR